MTTLPSGRYAGRITSPWWLRPLGLLWRGKVFEGLDVVNVIGPFRLIRGRVVPSQSSSGESFYIHYVGRLRDFVCRMDDGRYVGALLWPIDVRFTLTKDDE